MSSFCILWTEAQPCQGAMLQTHGKLTKPTSGISAEVDSVCKSEHLLTIGRCA